MQCTWVLTGCHGRLSKFKWTLAKWRRLGPKNRKKESNPGPPWAAHSSLKTGPPGGSLSERRRQRTPDSAVSFWLGSWQDKATSNSVKRLVQCTPSLMIARGLLPKFHDNCGRLLGVVVARPEAIPVHLPRVHRTNRMRSSENYTCMHMTLNIKRHINFFIRHIIYWKSLSVI